MKSEISERMRFAFAMLLADDDMVIYPQSCVGGDKPYEKRTDYMEGWNAYGSELLDKAGLLDAYLQSLPEPVVQMVVDEHLMVMVVRDKQPKLYVNCSDLFYWATADCEEISLEEIPALEQALQEMPNRGSDLWVARKRGMRPQAPYYRKLTEAESALFDAAGPERQHCHGRKEEHDEKEGD